MKHEQILVILMLIKGPANDRYISGTARSSKKVGRSAFSHASLTYNSMFCTGGEQAPQSYLFLGMAVRLNWR